MIEIYVHAANFVVYVCARREIYIERGMDAKICRVRKSMILFCYCCE